MHPSKTSLRFWAAWSFLRCGIGCWLEADHVHVLILHYAVIQLHGTAVPRQEPQDQEGRVHCPARELETPWHLARARAGHGTGDPLSIARAGARLRARVAALVAFKFQSKPDNPSPEPAESLFLSPGHTVVLGQQRATSKLWLLRALTFTAHGVLPGAPLWLPPDSSARQTGYAGREARKNREAHEARTSLRPADRAVWRR